MLKFITVVSIIIGMVVGIISIVQVISGQPTFFEQFASQIGEILDKGIELLDRCADECFD